MENNPFLKPVEFYQSTVNPIAQYIDQASFYIAKMKGYEFDSIRTRLREQIKTGKLSGMRDPVVHFYERQENGDKEPKSCKLSKYIQRHVQDKNVIAPTLTTYVSADKQESLLTEFTDDNVKGRGIAKKAAQAAEARGDILLAILKNNEQTNRKLFNNALSGAFASSGTPLHNPTAHSTLTTITRTESSIGNASNEKMVSGNRHYFDHKVTLNNIISLAKSVDESQMSAVIDKYGLKYPTIQDVETCIRYSTKLYWNDEKKLRSIMEFVSKLSPTQRAGVVYISDFYHLRLLNDGFIRSFITKLKSQVRDETIENPIKYIKTADELFLSAAHQFCINFMKGIGKDHQLLSLEQQQIVAGTIRNINNVIQEHQDFIDVFFLTKNLPPSTAYIPSMTRRSVVLSDTDSTMFSVDEWLHWYTGELRLNDEAYALGAAVSFMASQVVGHSLALFSANMNVQRKKLFQIQMKPEFMFPVFALTNVAKHYYSAQLVKEGNVYKDIKMEVKGVHLKNSAAPKSIMMAAEKKMESIIRRIMDGEKISLKQELHDAADIERRIAESVLNGEVVFYKRSKVKLAEGYKKGPEESPFQLHIFWNEVMAPKYGPIDIPPYSVIKIPTTLKNPSAIRTWIDGIQDKEFAARMAAWLLRKNKKALKTIYVPVTYVQANGIPEEIKPIINVKSIQLDLTLTNRIILETLGFYIKSNWLLSEQGY